jgi:GntR family transcriptional regulator/MocR family aminotransferase
MTTSARTAKRNRSTFFPPIALDAVVGKPIYRQLYDWFQAAIAEGRLRPGQRVPSTRSLAVELKVSRIPVLTAYEQLLAEGYFETYKGTGTAVAISIPQLGVTTSDRDNRPGLKSVRRPRLARRIEVALTMPFDPVPPPGTAFGACQPAVREFPHQIWSSLIARHSRRMPVATMGYGEVMGHLALREVIAEYLNATRGLRCDASQIMIVAGSQHGLQIAARTLLNEGDLIWMENPGYPRARRAFWMAGAKLVPVPIDNEGLDVRAAIKRCSHARAAYVTPSHQYPMGMTLSATRRMQLLDWASRANAWIIEDDYNSEFRFAGRPVAALQGLGTEDRVIYLGTFSKVLFPALRIGYLVIPKVLVRPFCVARDAMDIFPAPFLQEVLADFIREGHFSRHTRRMRVLYSSRQKSLLSALHSVLGFGAEIVGTDAGMHLVVLLPSTVDDLELGRRAAGVGLAVTPLSTCYHQPSGQKGLILGYAGVDERTIEASVKLLGRQLKRN